MTDINSITVWYDGKTKTFKGRNAWALAELIAAGSNGVTPITHPGPRWSSYVLNLRKEGFDIKTVTEAHAGAFAGHHARYVLNMIVFVEDRAAA